MTASVVVRIVRVAPGRAAAERLCRLYEDAFGAVGTRLWSAAEIAALLRQPGVVAWYAYAGTGDVPVGFLIVQTAGETAEIVSLGVAPGLRRRNVARHVLAAAFTALAERGVENVLLEVSAGNDAARALYSWCGFRTVGRRRDYFHYRSGETDDALVMSGEIVRLVQRLRMTSR